RSLLPFKLIERYVIGEVLRSFLLMLTTLTAIIVLFMIMAEASKNGLGPGDLVSLVPYVIPGRLPSSSPISRLFSVSGVYGRIAADNEIIARKSAGLSVLWTAILPSVYLGIGLSGLLTYFSGEAIPRANRTVKMMFFRSLEDSFYMVLRLERQFDNPDW